MITFITSLRHPDNSIDYTRIESLLFKTVRSVLNQQDRNFKFLIVCYRLPEFDLSGLEDYLEFVKVDFPHPIREENVPENLNTVRSLKGAKLLMGLIAAQKYNPNYIMFVDADDFISRNISGFVNDSDKQNNGWYLETGYIFCHKTNQLWKKDNFYNRCGTSLIINNNLITHPPDKGKVEFSIKDKKSFSVDTRKTEFIGKLTVDSKFDDILECLDNNFLKFILGSHRWTPQYYGLEPLPFPGCVWNWNTGENYKLYRLNNPGTPVDPDKFDWEEFGSEKKRR